MTEENAHIDALIALVLAGEATTAEQQELQAWTALSTENQLYFDRSRKLFDAVEKASPRLDVNVDAAWNKLEKRISPSEARVISISRNARMWRVAAAIIFIFTISVLVYRNYFSIPEPEVAINAGARPVTRSLPDGSSVTVNQNSSIAYVLKKGKRVVELKGEATFRVKHDSLQPFEVMVGELIVQDIGTAFTVKEMQDGKSVVVTVTEGEVHFYKEGQKGLNLVAGEEAEYDRQTGTFSRMLNNTNTETSSRIFDFRDTPLREVISRINDVYGADIRLRNAASGDCRVTVLFNQEQLDLMITVLSETFDMKVQRKGDVIYLEGSPCE